VDGFYQHSAEVGLILKGMLLMENILGKVLGVHFLNDGKKNTKKNQEIT